jgi:rubrerythrin
VEISTRELRSLVADVDDVHNESMRTLPDELGELHFGPTARTVVAARRRFLKQAGTGAALVTVAGWVTPLGGFLGRAAAAQDEPVDITAARYAAGVELAAVAAYGAAAGTGLITDPGVLGLATTFAGHHEAHAGTFNSLLTGNGADAVTEPDGALVRTFGPMIEAAADATTLLDIALTLENAAASTYYAALGVLTIPAAALAVAQILPVESQHAVVLATALGKPTEEILPPFETDADALALG